MGGATSSSSTFGDKLKSLLAQQGNEGGFPLLRTPLSGGCESQGPRKPSDPPEPDQRAKSSSAGAVPVSKKEQSLLDEMGNYYVAKKEQVHAFVLCKDNEVLRPNIGPLLQVKGPDPQPRPGKGILVPEMRDVY